MNTDVRNQHGAVCWGELITEDPKASAEFYARIFGWKAETVKMESGDDYTCFTTKDGAEVAGAMKTQCEGAPNHWGIHMHVDDVDAAAEATKKLGGKVLMAPFDCPEAGRIAYLADPQGAAFAVIKLHKPI